MACNPDLDHPQDPSHRGPTTREIEEEAVRKAREEERRRLIERDPVTGQPVRRK